jgi:tRNA1Val (adenine37-N6)-methyltransferase
VHQSQTAMKVCTDACLFGGWTAAQLKTHSFKSILDIGTGTGLLSLMLAQIAPSDTHIHAVEIETNAYNEASSNFQLSPWKHHIFNHYIALQDFIPDAKFDVIISNPPFYEGDLKSPSDSKNLASHAAALSWEDLCTNVNRLLSENGSFFVLIPAARAYTLQKLAEKEQLYLQKETLVYHQKETKIPFRTMMQFGRQKAASIERENIFIKNDKDTYSDKFVQLLKDYYLNL